MKKLSIFVQWVVVLSLFTFVGYGLFRSKPEPATATGPVNNWQGFYVLAYEGLTDDPDPRYVSPARFKEHLLALQEAGFQTVTLDQIKAFYYQNRPLPQSALLLLFEGGRSDHLIRATPVLYETGFRGNLAVATELPRQWGNHYLNAAQIRKLAQLHQWTLISMGHQSLKPVTVDTDNTKGHFLSNRVWTGSRAETFSEYQRRISGDIAAAAGKLSRWGGSVPEAFLFPYNDAGENARQDLSPSEILRNEVSQWHSLAFSSDGSPFNARNRDPLALTRMRVRDTLSGDELVTLLRSYRPAAPVKPTLHVPADHMDWITMGESTDVPESGLTIPDGSRIILKGSGVWPHFDWTGLLKVKSDTDVHLYVRYGGPQRFVRLRWSKNKLWIQEKNQAALHNISSAPFPVSEESLFIRIQIRNDRLRILDREGQLLLPSVSVGVKSPGSLMLEANHGSVRLEKWAFAPITDRYRMLNRLEDIPGVDPEAQTHLFFPLPRNLNELSAILPQLASLSSSGVLSIAVWPEPVTEETLPQVQNQLQDVRGEHPELMGFLRNIAIESSPQVLRWSGGLGDTVYGLISEPDDERQNLDLSDPGPGNVVLVFPSLIEGSDSLLNALLLQRPPHRMVFREDVILPSWPPEVGVLTVSSHMEKENAHETP